MTADYTIEATPGQVAAIKRDGFLVAAGQGAVPIVVEVVVPERECETCGGSGCDELSVADYEAAGIPIDLDDVDLGMPGQAEDCMDCTDGTIPARTLLRGVPEAVPVVEDPDDLADEPQILSISPIGTVFLWPEGESGPDGVIDVTHHFADVPHPEVGDTDPIPEVWIIRGEGS